MAYSDNKSASFTVTYDSGTDGNCVSEEDRKRAGIPVLRKSTKRVSVTSSSISRANNAVPLPIPHLSKKAAEAHTFEDFPSSVLSGGKVKDDGKVCIFSRKGVTVHKEEDVLITV